MPRENSPHPGVPTLDAGEKKFNWCLVAPTILQDRPIVVSGGGLFRWNLSFPVVSRRFKNRGVQPGVFLRLGRKRFAFLVFLQFKIRTFDGSNGLSVIVK